MCMWWIDGKWFFDRELCELSELFTGGRWVCGGLSCGKCCFDRELCELSELFAGGR